MALHVEQFDEVLRQLRVNRQIPATALRRWQVAAGQPPSESAGTTTRTRPTYSDLDYARIARDYQRLCQRTGMRPITALAKQRGISPSTARGLVARAREAGMLTPGHQGQHGGVVTDRAEQLLASRQRKYKKR